MASNKNNDYMRIVHACVYEHVYVDLVSSCFVACGGDGNVRLYVSWYISPAVERDISDVSFAELPASQLW